MGQNGQADPAVRLVPMIKRVLLLNGAAIIGVLVNHSAGWGYHAMVWWADSYSDVAVPAYAQVSRPAYFAVLCLWQLPLFSVPAFLFVAGFFLAFALRGHAAPGLTMLRNRIVRLTAPYLIWSLVYIGGRALDVDVPLKSGHTYLAELVSTGVYGPYFFIPLLIKLNLVGFLIWPFVVRHPWALLCLAAAVQWGTMGISYLNTVWDTPVLAFLGCITPTWTLARYLFWFVLGLVGFLRQSEVTRWVQHQRSRLTVITLALSMAAIVGPALLFEARGIDWRSSPLTISTSLYATVFILWFLSIKELPVRLCRKLQCLAGNSYGIYLIHMPMMEICSRVLKRLAPRFLAQHVVFGAIVFAVGLGGPVLLMETVRRTPLRKAYRVLFG